MNPSLSNFARIFGSIEILQLLGGLVFQLGMGYAEDVNVSSQGRCLQLAVPGFTHLNLPGIL